MKEKWNRSPSPRDGNLYRVTLRNCIGDRWESDAYALPNANNGWGTGIWQDWANEVKGWKAIERTPMPLNSAAEVGNQR